MKRRKEKNIKERKEKKKDILTPAYSLDENARRHI
jgi:hypothetical protein